MTTNDPVYTYTPVTPGTYSVHVGATRMGTVTKRASGQWVAYTADGTAPYAAPTRSGAAAAMGSAASAAPPVPAPAPVAAPVQAPTTPWGDPRYYPGPTAPQGRAKPSPALLAVVLVLVGVCSLVAGTARLFALPYTLVGRAATAGSRSLRRWVAAQHAA